MDEMDERPKILALENVLGLLSSDGGRNYISLAVALILMSVAEESVVQHLHHSCFLHILPSSLPLCPGWNRRGCNTFVFCCTPGWP